MNSLEQLRRSLQCSPNIARIITLRTCK